MPKQTHQLAAIMFTDIVGYTALMGEDENNALTILERNREIHKKTISQFHGKYLKEIGDGTLATFHSSTDAIYCAGKLLQISKELGYPLKVALHEGEIVFDNQVVFGDGVNVAARLESEATPGQIFSTASIARNIKNKEGIRISYKGEKSFKNVSEPLKIYSIEVDPNNSYKPGFGSTKSKKVAIYFLLSIIAGIVIISLWISNSFETKEINTVSQHSTKTLAVLPVEYIRLSTYDLNS